MYCASKDCKKEFEKKNCVQEEGGNKLFCSISCRNFHKRGDKPSHAWPESERVDAPKKKLESTEGPTPV